MEKKWNWIDTVVVIVLIAAVVLFFNRGKLTGGITVGPSNTKNIVMTVEVDELKAEIATGLKEGDQIFSQNKLQNATIKEVNNIGSCNRCGSFNWWPLYGLRRTRSKGWPSIYPKNNGI